MQPMQLAGQESIVAIAADFAEQVLRPRAGEIDQNEALPREILDGLAKTGLLGATVPEKYGGLGLDPVTYGLVTETIGKACCSTRALLTVHTSLVCETLVKLGSAAQKERYLPGLAAGTRIGCFALSEPGSGSDANSVQTRYESNGTNFVLNGQKKWISFGEIADLMIVIAKEGSTVSAFLVEKEMKGIEVKPIKGMMGNRATHMAEITFTDVEVPAENVLCRLGTGFSFVVNTALFFGRYSIAWAGLAIAQAALEEMTSYARHREQFGQKIGQFQLVKGMIADSVTQVHAARALCNKIAELRLANHDQAIMETNIAKYFTSKVAVDVTSNAVQVFGARGCWNEFPVERLYRESKILEIIEGSSQIQQVLIANHGLKKYGRRGAYTK